MTKEELHKIVLNEIANNQGDLFEYVASGDYDFLYFVHRFLTADRTERSLDGRSTPYQDYFPPQLLTYYPEDILMPGSGFDKDVAWWMGWAYRRLAQEKHLLSKDIDVYLPPETMIQVYPAFHTFIRDEYLIEELYNIYQRNV